MKTQPSHPLPTIRHEVARSHSAAAGAKPAADVVELRQLLHGVKLMAQAGGQDEEPPSRLLVVPWGLTQTKEGPLLCDEGTAKILPQRQADARADRVAIDLDHGAAFGANKGQPRHIAGYGTPQVVEGEGVWLMDIRWTPTGKKFWANYEDLSPAILQQKGSGRVTFLDSVALTPRGMIEGLSLFSAESDTTKNPTPPQSKPARMNPDKLKKFLKARGIAYKDDATTEELATLAEAAMEDMVEGEGSGTLSSEVGAKLKVLEDQVQALKSADASRHKANEDARKAEIIRQASAAGKVLPPDEVIKNMSADDLQLTADAARAGTVKTSPHGGLNADQKGNEKPTTLSAEDKEVARMMGISEETALKFAAYGEAPIRLA